MSCRIYAGCDDESAMMSEEEVATSAKLNSKTTIIKNRLIDTLLLSCITLNFVNSVHSLIEYGRDKKCFLA
jgi:hypothetical protein